ncbi:MAG: ATP-dependent DNA helicase [Candidatus Acidiferrales bacterium]
MATLFDDDAAPRPARAKNAKETPDGLNAEQRAAVRHGEGPLMVVAGAGTGKTRVITERIRYLLESQPELDGGEILGLTFTEKAAAEMKRRVVASAGERGERVVLGTFHSFCAQMLTERDPGVRTLDRVDHWILLRRNLARLGLDRYRRLAEPGQFLGDFEQFFSRCQDELVSPEDYQAFADELAARYAREKAALAEDERALREEEIARQQEIARVYRESDALLRERHLLTFGTQLMGGVTLLRNDPELLATLRERYRYILVDEFQDTNIAQLELLHLLGGERRNLVVVGDHRQAIYRFRGASFGSFAHFLDEYAGASPAERARVQMPLRRNYRSTRRILRVANEVERHLVLPAEQPKDFQETGLVAEKSEGERIRVVTLASSDEEARWIAAEIERLHGAGARWRSMAVLYRMHTHRERLVTALRDSGVPFVIRNLSILDHRLVRDILAYIRLAADVRDDVACARVLAAPAWGLEAQDLQRLAERAAKARGGSLWDVIESAQGELAFDAGRAGLQELIALVGDLRRRARELPALEWFDELLGRLEIGVAVSEQDRKYVGRLRQFIFEWQPKSETRRLKELAEYLDYFDQANGQINLEEEHGDAVQLMTVHSAKGLEFDHVFVIHLVHGGFPAREKPHVLEFPAELMKEQLPAGDFHIQEERRLFYVALTRARDRLTLTTVVGKRSKPSPFLDDILMAPKVQRADLQQLAPEHVPEKPAAGTAAESGGAALFAAERAQSRVGSRIGQWAETYRPPLSEPLPLSASAIGTFESCPQKYLFTQLWGIRTGPRATLTFGNVMHTTIGAFVGQLRKGRRLPFEEVAAIYEREWSAAGYEDTYQEQEYKKDGLAQLRAFHQSTLEAPPEVFAQERRFELPLANRIVLTGRMDQVNRAGAPGEKLVEIVDYKTGRPKTDAHAKKDLQLSVYALAAREVFGEQVARLVFYNVQNNQSVAATRDAKQLARAEEDMQEVAAEIRAGNFPTKIGFSCKACEFRLICPAHDRGAKAAPEDT